ncbi:MAG TPA: TRAM domain-containing protein, partial [Corynebacterium sp.]|nr:TRAM domain-containing protein [Corynebacterium sp.]
MSETTPSLESGATLTLTATRMAHGGEAIAHDPEGRVVFLRGAYPGDTVQAEVTEVKKRFARAAVLSVEDAGPYRGAQRCPAAARGAGCCDFSDIAPERELELKAEVLAGQLSRILDPETLPAPELLDLSPDRGWRTRVRLGVDAQGRAGTRMLRSHDLVTEVACSQVAEGLLDGIVGPGARTFTPGAEIVAVLDAAGRRHIVETRKARRGSRVEKFTEVIEGGGMVTERADGVEFSFPPTAFWQAHVQAPETYTALVRRWLADLTPATERPVAWDLYGGVGLFVPALGDVLGERAQIFSVDYSR